MGDDQDLQIRVTTTGDTTGSDQVADSLAKVGSAATSANKEAEQSTNSLTGAIKEQRTGLREARVAGREFHEIIEGLGRASQGGAGALGGMATALRGFIGIARTAIGATGPIGLIALALGAIVGVLASFSSKAKEAGEATKGVGDASAKAAKELEEMEKAAEKSYKKQTEEIEKLKADYNALVQAINQAYAAIDKMTTATRKLEDAETEREKEKKLKGAKSDSERSAIEDKYARQKIKTEADRGQTDLDNRKLEDQVKIKAADDQLKALGEQAEAARAKIADADRAKQDAIAAAANETTAEESLLQEGKTPTKSAEEARAHAKTVSEETDKETERQNKALKDLNEQADKAQGQKDEAKQDIQVATIDAKTVTVNAQNETSKEDAKMQAKKGKVAVTSSSGSSDEAGGGLADELKSTESDFEAAFGGGSSKNRRSELKQAMSDSAQADQSYHEANVDLHRRAREQTDQNTAELRNLQETGTGGS